MFRQSDFASTRIGSNSLPTRRTQSERSRQGPEYLLLPVTPWFIWISILVGLLLNVFPVGKHIWLPDVLAVVLVFWNVHQPRRVGLGVAFFLGLIMDVHSGAVLGQHALAYSVLSFLAIAIHRRLVWFSPLVQSLHVFPLFFLAQLLVLVVRLMLGGHWPGLAYHLAPILEALLWPLAWALLLAPQRRPVDADKNRPVL